MDNDFTMEDLIATVGVLVAHLAHAKNIGIADACKWAAERSIYPEAARVLLVLAETKKVRDSIQRN